MCVKTKWEREGCGGRSRELQHARAAAMGKRFLVMHKIVINLKVLRKKLYIEADFDGEHWSFPLAVRVHEDMVLLKDGLPAL